MKIAIHTPFGGCNEEAGLMYLLASYIRPSQREMFQIRCNGVFSACDRDSEAGWSRSFDSCARCAYEQASLAEWASLPVINLGSYIKAPDIASTRAWASGLDSGNLKEVEFKGTMVFELAAGTLVSKNGPSPLSGTSQSNTSQGNTSQGNDEFVRKIYLSVARMLIASNRLIAHTSPSMIWVAGGKDYISRSLLHQARKEGVTPIIFQWDVNARSVQVINAAEGRIYSCNLIINNLATVRGDSGSWPNELTDMLNELVGFLSLPESQLPLPFAAS